MKPRHYTVAAVALLIIAFHASAQNRYADLDIPALILETNHHGVAMSNRMFDYTWTQTVSYRLVNRRGKIRSEPLRVFEVYPMPGRRLIKKLVSENGVAVSAERAAKELRRVSEELEKAEREEQKKRARPPASSIKPEPAKGCLVVGYLTEFFGADDEVVLLSIPDLLCAGEFSSPRQQMMGGRETIVLDFRAREDYVPPSKARAPIANLAGSVWIDAADRVVKRLEAWPASSNEKEPVLVYEQVRLSDGTWLHSSTRFNSTKHRQAFNGVSIDFEDRFTDHQRFTTAVEEYKLNAPKSKP